MKNTAWIDLNEYPFKSNFLNLESGAMHYLDEGTGEAIVMVHGTPVWSFLYRNLVKELSRNYRCIVPDHIGFGLSAKPANWSYTPQAHSENLSRLLDHLQLKNITLIVHDFGGPIGLKYALDHPDKIKRLIIINTWMWSLANEISMVKASQFFGSLVGRFLYKYLNFSVKFLLPKAFYRPQKLTPAIHRHYLKAMPTPTARTGAWRLAKELTASGSWFDSLWQRRNLLLNKPMLIIWGMKDAFIPASFLSKWQAAYPHAQVVKLDSGHFVQEEMPDELAAAVTNFFKANTNTSAV